MNVKGKFAEFLMKRGLTTYNIPTLFKCRTFLDEIENEYQRAFHFNPFDLNGDKYTLIRTIQNHLKNKRQTSFAEYNARKGSGIPNAILNTHYITFLFSFNEEGKDEIGVSTNFVMENDNYNIIVEMREVSILQQKKQIILQGAPGTGKTYKTAEIAVAICDGIDTTSMPRSEIMRRYKALISKGQIAFTTFHQSMDYEEFIEGVKPITENEDVIYKVQDGIFKRIAKEADVLPHVLIIDEINRGNISKIFGELITLLEADKRIGEENEVTVTLPYSQETFGVPSNLYIIGTMNTADRSVGYIDYAVRRRFAFITLKADRNVIENYYTDEALKRKALDYFDKVDGLMKVSSEYDKEDLMIGHSYFLAQDEEELMNKMCYEVRPLLLEYFNDGLLTFKKDSEEYQTIKRLGEE